METKKTSSVATIFERNNSAETEKKPEKSSAVGITSVKDTFQVVTNKNGGLFSENRFAQPTGENSGLKDLTPSEQQQTSGMTYKDFQNFKSSSLFTQDNRTKYEDAKNSGLLEGLGHGKQDIDEQTKERLKGRTADSIKDLNSPMAPEQTNDAIRQLTGDTSLRDFVKQEVAERHEEFNKLGNGTALERFAKSLDPSSSQDSVKPFGKDQLAYNRQTEHKNKDGSTTKVYEMGGTEDGTAYSYTVKVTDKKDGTRIEERKETIYTNDTKKEKESKTVIDANGKVTDTTTEKTTKNDGTVTSSTTTTTRNKDGSGTTNTTTTTTPGGGTKSYDPENYKGNVPEVLQRTMDHLKEQAKKLRPEGGGERVLTDGGASGTPMVGGEVGNVSPRMGGIYGMVGQPTQAGEEIGHGSLGGGSNPDQNGGATDVDGNNWTGGTIEDDPTDVHFGPADQPKQKADSKDEESNDSSKSFLDSFRRIRA